MARERTCLHMLVTQRPLHDHMQEDFCPMVVRHSQGFAYRAERPNKPTRLEQKWGWSGFKPGKVKRVQGCCGRWSVAMLCLRACNDCDALPLRVVFLFVACVQESGLTWFSILASTMTLETENAKSLLRSSSCVAMRQVGEVHSCL